MRHKPDPVLAALSEHDIVLVTLWGEVRGEPVEGQIAVANVLRNRLTSRRWGRTYHDVCLAWAQFSCLWPTLGGENFLRLLAFAERVKAVEKFSPQERQLRWITAGLLSGDIIDNTDGSTHYYADYIVPPKWSFPPSRYVGKYGHHRFFAGVQ